MSVPAALRASPLRAAGRFLGVLVDPRTYKNLVYLSLAFPLGMAYFITLVLFFSLGVGLTIVLVGIPMLATTVLLVHELTAFERWQARHLLGADVPVVDEEPAAGVGEQFKRIFLSVPTWRGFVFLMSKFPIGVALFAVLSVPFSMLLGFVVAPIHFLRTGESLQFVSVPEAVTVAPSIVYEVEAFRIALTVPFRVTDWYVDTPAEAALVFLVGVVFAVAVLHLTNLLARALGWYAVRLLGNTRESLAVRLFRALSER